VTDCLKSYIGASTFSKFILSCFLCSLFMAALRSTCGHYIFALWFLFLSSFFLSLPNLSRRRLDVYHTSTGGVALVQIYNACLKCAACGSLKIQDVKNHFGTIAQLCRAVSSQLRHVSTIGKKLVKHRYLLHIFS